MSHGLEGAKCEYNINNETMRQIKLIMRYARMMPGKYQIWNRSVQEKNKGVKRMG